MCLLLAGVAWGQTTPPRDETFAVGDLVLLVLKDGTFVEGEILVKTSTTLRLKSAYSVRSYNRRDIDRIVADVDFSDADSVERCEQLPSALKATFNARADYHLGKYEQALARVKPFLEYEENQATQNLIHWLIIEIYERQGRWDDAKRMLKTKKKQGSPREKLRAQAHLDIFKWNPDYDLRYVGTKHARNFLIIADEHLRNKAREPDSLMEGELMSAALAEYCEQKLKAEGFSVPALESFMDVNKTYEALRELQVGRDIEKNLPYLDMLERAEKSVSKVQAVLPGYGDIYEVQLVRVEMTHLFDVWFAMGQQALQVSPQEIVPAFNAQTGRLTRAGREQLKEQCDEFIKRTQRVIAVLEYIQSKARRHPVKLSSGIELQELVMSYLQNMIKWARKMRQKTRV